LKLTKSEGLINKIEERKRRKNRPSIKIQCKY